MKTWKIPCTWTVWATMKIEAETLEEAVDIAVNGETPLPTDTEYMEDSFEVDMQLAEEMN